MNILTLCSFAYIIMMIYIQTNIKCMGKGDEKMADKVIGYGRGTFEDRNGKKVKWAKLYCTVDMKETHEGDQCFVGTRAYAIPVDFDASDAVFAEVIIGEEHDCDFNQYGKVKRVTCAANPF